MFATWEKIKILITSRALTPEVILPTIRSKTLTTVIEHSELSGVLGCFKVGSINAAYVGLTLGCFKAGSMTLPMRSHTWVHGSLLHQSPKQLERQDILLHLNLSSEI